MKKALAVILAVFAVLTLCAPNAKAQAADASITGRVLDPANATVAGVTITVINTDTQVTHKTATNGDGLYFVPNLPPGKYRVEAAKTGFKTTIKPDVILNVQDVTAINFNMILGTVAESVTVKGGASLINTADGSVGTVVDRTFIENIPLNGRTLQGLIELTPGVVVTASTASGTKGQFSVDGQRAESSSFMVDGVSANVGASQPGAGNITASGNLPGLTATGTTQPLASLDAIQEFKVQTSSFAAEYGTRPGGQIAIVTRSGTNRYHGTGFDYLRNTVFDANDWFADRAGSPRPPEHQNDFGGTLGGAVRIPGVYNGLDRTFFFVSYEGLRLGQPVFSLTNVPDLCLRGLAPTTGATSCAAVNTTFGLPTGTQAAISPAPAALLPLLNAFPLPNGQDIGNGMADFSAGYSSPNTLNATSIRIDHTINSKLTLFARYSDSPSMSGNLGNDLASDTILRYQNHAITLGATSVLSPKTANDLRINFTSNSGFASAINTTLGGAVVPARSAAIPAQFDPGAGASGGINLLLPNRTESGTPTFSIQDNFTNSQHQFEIVDSFSYAVGSHQLKFGVDYRRLTPNNAANIYALLGTFTSTAQVEAATASGSLSSGAPRYPEFTNTGAYGEDTWKVSRRLTLTLGLRWELDPAPSERSGKPPLALTEISNLASTALAPTGTPQWQTTWLNFAPRFGAAYQISQRSGHETVLRGGGGIFYDTGNNAAGQAIFQSFPYSASASVPTLNYPYVASQVTPVAVPVAVVAPYPSFFAFDPHLQLPYTWQWNVALQQSFGRSQSLTVTYAGNHAQRLLQESSISIHAINANFNGLSFTTNNATSDYDALQAQFQRRLAHGLQALVGYTWAHALDWDSSSFTGFGALRGNAAFDIRHVLTSALTYDIPAPGKSALSRAILGHWSTDVHFLAQSAPPLDLTGGIITNPVTGVQSQGRLTVIPGIPWYVNQAQCTANYNAVSTNLVKISACPGGRAVNNALNDATLAQGIAAGCAITTNAVTHVQTITANKGPFCSQTTGTSGNLGRNQVRGLGAWQQDMAVQRDFPLHEGLLLEFRAEAFNLLNHANFGSVTTSVASATFGQPTAMLNNALGGGLNALYQIGGPRSLQFALKLKF